MTSNSQPGPDIPALNIDTEGILQRNDTRKRLRQNLAPGIWYVRENAYRGLGSKFQVRRKVTAQAEADDEIIIPDGSDRQNKDFIVFARNDSPETDIDQLLAKIETIKMVEANGKAMVERIRQLESIERQLQEALRQAQQGREDAVKDLLDFQHQTEAQYYQAAIIREALMFYAVEENWEWQLAYNKMLMDNGETARHALANSEAGSELLEKLKQKLQSE